MSLMKRGLEAYRRELQKERFGVGRKAQRVRSPSADGASGSNSTEDADRAKSSEKAEHARDAKTARDAEHSQDAETATRSRHVPAAVARAVYLRDGGCCTFCSEDGPRCGARRFLELDHITPWAVGGGTTVAPRPKAPTSGNWRHDRDEIRRSGRNPAE